MVTVVSTVPHPSVVREVICWKCGSTLEYTPNDVQTKKDFDYTGSFDIVHYITCPPCGKEIIVARQ